MQVEYQIIYLILCSVSNKPLSVSEGHIAGCCPVSLIICNDLNLSVLEGSYTGVCGPKINSDSISLCHYV